MCLENTWYSALFLTIGTWWSIGVTIVFSLWLTLKVIDWCFGRAELVYLAYQFVRDKEDFKQWKSNQDNPTNTN